MTLELSMTLFRQFRKIWMVDFEFYQPDGDNPHPLCMVAREFRSHQLIRLFGDQLTPGHIPFDLTDADLVIAYYASAEVRCFIELNWPLPANILDLFTEFARKTSGWPLASGRGLAGAMQFYGLSGVDVVEKESMRKLAQEKRQFSDTEKIALLNYCQSDVDALKLLVERMCEDIDIRYALHRGRFMKAAGIIESNGIPIDAPLFRDLSSQWGRIKQTLIQRFDRHGIWRSGCFNLAAFEQLLNNLGIAWFKTDRGTIKTDDESFKTLAASHPEIQTIHQLRKMLGSFNLRDVHVGTDGRNRCMLSAFRSRTSRCQPSNAHFIFGAAAWLRSLMKPTDGNALAYIDWSQQEFGIAAALSGDENMIKAYLSGDPYLAFPKQAGEVPQHATKKSHPEKREQFKQCILAVQYGMGAESLATVLNQGPATARRLLDLHKRTYQKFWKWSDNVVNFALYNNHLNTVFDWRTNVIGDPNPRSLANFPMQANGAEMLRLACCLAIDQGVKICAPVHDAVLIEAPTDEIHGAISTMEEAMAEASRIILQKFPLRTDAKVIKAPDRYSDEKRGLDMWNAVMEIIGRPECAIPPR